MNELSLLEIQAATTYEQARENFKTKFSAALGSDNALAKRLCSAWEKVKRERFRQDNNSQERYLSDDKVKISLPVYLLSNGNCARIERDYASIGGRRESFDAYLRANLNEAARTGFPPTVAPSEIISHDFFSILAERINLYMSYCAACHPRGPLFQVGVDKDEAFSIVNLHSWYKRFAGYGAVTVPVSVNDLGRKQSEQDYYGPHVLSARGGQYLSLNATYTVREEDILQWQTGQNRYYGNIRIPDFLLNMPRAAAAAALPAAPLPGVSAANPFANYFGLFLRSLWQVEENVAPQVARANAVEESDIILPGRAPAQAEVKVFEGVVDPVMFDRIDEAVTTCSGWTYNESTILEVLRTNPRNPADPMTRASLSGAEAYRKNHTVKALIRKGFDPSAQSRALPQEFVDPFSNSLIKKPVLAEDGYCYDADALKLQCQRSADGLVVSPHDNTKRIGKSLFIDRTMIALLDEYHANRTDNVEGLLPCFPEQMSVAQLLENITHYSEMIDVESGRKMRNFYLADRLLGLLEIKAQDAEEKIIAKLKRGLLDYQHAINSGSSKIESAARTLLCISQALTDLLSINNFSKTDQIISLLGEFFKISNELFRLVGSKKPALLEQVNLEALQQNIARLPDVFTDKVLNPRQKLYRIQELLQQKTLVMYDYDGTLVTIGVPKRAITDKALLKRELMSQVANPNVTVAICSKQGQEKRSANSVEQSIEEFLLRELEMSAEDVAKIQLYGMDAYNAYMKAEAGKPPESIVPFKVAVANKIHRENAGMTKFVYVNDSMYELEEMQKCYPDVVAVPVLLNATTNHLISDDIFTGLIARENYKGAVDASVVMRHVKLDEAWKAGYTTECSLSREMRNKDERHMHCAAAGYFLMTIEVLRTFIENESRAREKSNECIRLATRMIHELAQLNPRELTPTAIQGYLNIQLGVLKRQATGHRLASWLVVVIDQIKSGLLAQPAFLAGLEQQEEGLRADTDRQVKALEQQRQKLAVILVDYLTQQFPGFTCQYAVQLDKYKNPKEVNDNFRLNPQNVFKDCVLTPGCSFVKEAFVQAARDIKSKTQFDAKSAAASAAIQVDVDALAREVFNKVFAQLETIKKPFDEQQGKTTAFGWLSGKQDNPVWKKPVNQNSLGDWLQSVVDYLKLCKKINADHPAITLMQTCHELLALPISSIAPDKVNEFVSALESRIRELRQQPVARPL